MSGAISTNTKAVPLLTGNWLKIARAAWLALALVTGIFLLTSLPAYVQTLGGDLAHVTEENENVVTAVFASLSGVASLATALLSYGLAILFFRRRFAEPVAAGLAFYLLVYAVVMAGPMEHWSSYWLGDQSLVLRLQTGLVAIPTIALLVLFPNGRFVPKWSRWVLLLVVPIALALFVLPTNDMATITGSMSLLVMGLATGLIACYGLGFYAQYLRYRRVSSPIERQQTKWVVYGLALWLMYMLLSSIPYYYLENLPPEAPIPWWAAISVLGWFVSLSIVPVCLAVAVMRYRLWDIDILINRTLVYGVLTALIVGMYALVVGGAGVLFQQRSNLAGLLITVVLFIIFFKPLRTFLQQGADKLVRVDKKRPLTDATIPVQTKTPDQTGHSEFSLTNLTGGWLRLAQAIWLVLALTVFGLYIWAVTDLWWPTDMIYAPWDIFMPLGFFIIAAVIVWRKPNDGVALLTSLMFIFAGPYLILGLNETIGDQPGWDLISRVLVGLGFSMLILFQAVFPDGRFVPRWIRWWVLLFIAVIFACVLLLPEIYSGLGVSVFLVGMISGVLAQIYRYRNVSNTEQRQQTKWVLVGLLSPVLVIIYWFLIITPGFVSFPTDRTLYVIHQLIFAALALLLPLTLAFSILRYRLWDIDIIINRALVYVALTACVIAVYILVVGAMGTLFQTQTNWLIALIATGLVAVLFQPLRERWQKWVNQLLYGQRDEPFEVLASLGQQLEDTMSPETVYPTIVETVAQTLKLPYVAIAVNHQGQMETAVSHGRPTTNLISYPLIYQSEQVGQLQVSPRAADEPFSEADERILRNIARQAGTAVHAVQLTNDLQQSRQQIVTSREEERRRLRRDLHDGLGPTLAAHMLKIGSARALLSEQPEMTDQLLSEMETDIEITLADLRRIVYNLRPPALDQWGLGGALHAYAQSCEQNGTDSIIEITVNAPEVMPSLPAAVEVAAYHIGREALTNVMRHAQASHCKVQLQIEEDGNGRLCLTIQDDGKGFELSDHAGVGLASMRERAAELGGSCMVSSEKGKGTLVTAVLPLNTKVRTDV